MLRHIEDNECRNNWTIQYLNALAEECNGSVQLIIPRRGCWFRAGAPPLKPRGIDYKPYEGCFTCSICDEDYELRFELKEHLKERGCCYDYPCVLQCPSCPDYEFERLSEFLERLECQRYRTACAKRWLAGLAQRLERKFEDPRVQRRLGDDSYGLRADGRIPGRLRVL